MRDHAATEHSVHFLNRNVRCRRANAGDDFGQRVKLRERIPIFFFLFFRTHTCRAKHHAAQIVVVPLWVNDAVLRGEAGV